MDANTKSVLEKLRRDFEEGEDLKFLVSSSLAKPDVQY